MARTRDQLTTRDPDLTSSWPQVCGWRLARQHVTALAADAVGVASRLCGVQAQVTSSAHFAVGVRSPATDDDVDAALWTERTLVRTWAMRGTLHWLPAAEYGLWIAALTTRRWRITPSWEKYHGVTAAELDAVTRAIPEVLAGRRLTREELADGLADATGRAHLAEQLTSGWGAVLKPAANRGLLCFGPDRDRNITFVRPDEWLGDTGPAPKPEEAMRLVLRRFLDAYGPATPGDIARWFGEREPFGRQLLARHAEELAVVRVDGHRGWMTPEGATALAEHAPAEGVALLGGFDPYVLAPISHRVAIVPDGRLDEVSRTAGWISAVVLVDGMVAGTWTTEADGDATRLVISPFRGLTATERAAIDQRVAQLAGHVLPAGARATVART
ncbi:MAG TPA: winged helix DNA-binding domain-containing protein [Euzebyales bacterium]|nr:winged helix DNA-binding domain-containing protein [Euzebyales bacterium]